MSYGNTSLNISAAIYYMTSLIISPVSIICLQESDWRLKTNNINLYGRITALFRKTEKKSKCMLTMRRHATTKVEGGDNHSFLNSAFCKLTIKTTAKWENPRNKIYSTRSKIDWMNVQRSPVVYSYRYSLQQVVTGFRTIDKFQFGKDEKCGMLIRAFPTTQSWEKWLRKLAIIDASHTELVWEMDFFSKIFKWHT